MDGADLFAGAAAETAIFRPVPRPWRAKGQFRPESDAQPRLSALYCGQSLAFGESPAAGRLAIASPPTMATQSTNRRARHPTHTAMARLPDSSKKRMSPPPRQSNGAACARRSIILAVATGKQLAGNPLHHLPTDTRTHKHAGSLCAANSRKERRGPCKYSQARVVLESTGPPLLGKVVCTTRTTACRNRSPFSGIALKRMRAEPVPSMAIRQSPASTVTVIH